MAEVFVSYKREDLSRVRKLVMALRAAGLDAWWDEDIPPSAPWEATIERALADAKAVIVCWSPDAVASENVRAEARAAREDGRLIQTFLRPCTLPLFFGERQGVDLSNWRGRADDRRIGELVDAIRAKTGATIVQQDATNRTPRWLPTRMVALAAMLVLLFGAGIGWWLLDPARASGPKTIAILPFRALNPADANLVDAIWDDTRGAISRNPNLRVLGRTAVETLARRNLEPKDYRRQVGADYLLDGGVQRQGDRVEINVSLVSTADGSEVWTDRVGGKLDDVFAFQQRIAQEVEGKIRGRVAPDNGVKVQNIATNGEVYSIYADARAEIRKRDPQALAHAIALLNRAVELDPNYAPAWADLGSSTALFRAAGGAAVERQRKSVEYLRRALALAPNLSHAHAALAMVQHFPPSSEGELKRAVALDPSDPEAWQWLGNFYSFNFRYREALAAHSKAVEIEPLWFTAAANKLSDLGILNDRVAIDAELVRAKATGDPVYFAKIGAMAALVQSRVGDYVLQMARLRQEHPEEAPFVDSHIDEELMALGYSTVALHFARDSAGLSAAYAGNLTSVARLRSLYSQPAEFWGDEEASAVVGRQLRKIGRLADYEAMFLAAFPGPDPFAAGLDERPHLFLSLAPSIAVNLRDAGREDLADQILGRGEAIAAPWMNNGSEDWYFNAQISRLRAAEGKGDQAIGLLAKAVAQGWIPDGGMVPLDIADEPSYARLLNRADFQALRRKIFERQAEERRRAGPLQAIYAALDMKMAA